MTTVTSNSFDTIDCCFGNVTALLALTTAEEPQERWTKLVGPHFYTLCVVALMVPFQVMEKIPVLVCTDRRHILQTVLICIVAFEISKPLLYN